MPGSAFDYSTYPETDLSKAIRASFDVALRDNTVLSRNSPLDWDISQDPADHPHHLSRSRWAVSEGLDLTQAPIVDSYSPESVPDPQLAMNWPRGESPSSFRYQHNNANVDSELFPCTTGPSVMDQGSLLACTNQSQMSPVSTGYSDTTDANICFSGGNRYAPVQYPENVLGVPAQDLNHFAPQSGPLIDNDISLPAQSWKMTAPDHGCDLSRPSSTMAAGMMGEPGIRLNTQLGLTPDFSPLLAGSIDSMDPISATSDMACSMSSRSMSYNGMLAESVYECADRPLETRHPPCYLHAGSPSSSSGQSYLSNSPSFPLAAQDVHATSELTMNQSVSFPGRSTQSVRSDSLSR